MSYCQFENTFPDLKDCLDALREGKKLSESEKRYAKEMLEEIVDFVMEHELVTEVNDEVYRDKDALDSLLK